MIKKTRVLVCNPPHILTTGVYLPLLWALFKTYQETQYSQPLNVDWLDPIFEIDDPIAETDVLLVSNYVWNFETNLKYIAEAKRLNPECLIIAGGPESPFNDKQMFEKYNFDVVVAGEGEHVVCEILYRYENNLPFEGIPGAHVRGQNRLIPQEKLNLETMVSPYAHCFEDLARFSDRVRQKDKFVVAPLETNRGCPFQCAFCDWGSDINSKFRHFSEKEVSKSIEAISQLKAELVFVTDSNYGTFKRDIDFIEQFVENKKLKGYPRFVTFQSAKNKKKWVSACHKRLHDAGMVRAADIGFQHTDEEVLRNIKRENIKTENLKAELTENRALGIPSTGVLIAGMPGDNPQKWRKAFDDLLHMGFHEVIKVSDFHLIVNSPAAQPDYIEKFQIKTKRKRYAEKPTGRQPYSADIVVSTSSFTENDYLEMQMFSACVQGCHNLNVVRFVAMLLYHYKAVPYSTFYQDFQKLPPMRSIFLDLSTQLEDYLVKDKAVKFVKFEGQDCLIEEFVYFSCLSEIHGIYKSLRNYLQGHLDEGLIEDLCLFNKNLIVGFHEHLDFFTTRFDLITYFNKLMTLPPGIIDREAPELRTTHVHLEDLSIGLNKEHDFRDISSLSELRSQVLKSPNWRHQATYFASVLGL
jgi:putative methyltransferase